MAKMAMTQPSDPEAPDDTFEIEHGFDTLLKAHEIKQKPDLMAKIKLHAEKKKHAISSIADLKKKYKSLPDEGQDT